MDDKVEITALVEFDGTVVIGDDEVEIYFDPEQWDDLVIDVENQRAARRGLLS